MKDSKQKSAAPVAPADPAAVARILGDPAAAAAAPPEVALVAVEAARAGHRPEVLWALSSHPAKEIGKAARRALHLLRSRGVEVGEPPAAPAPKSTLAKVEEASEPCRTTVADGFGDRALWIPLKSVQGFELWELILSDEIGVREIHRVALSRKQLRAHFDSLPKDGLGAHELPRARAAGLLAGALELGGGPREQTEARGLLEQLGGGDPTMAVPVSAGASPPADDGTWLAEAASLFDEPELRTFVPAEQLLRELAVRLDEVEVSPLLLDGRQKSDRRQHVLDQAVEGYFTPSLRARYARRLFELCDLWTVEGRSAAAARAGAAARQLEGSASSLENPFARRMFDRIFAASVPAEAPTPEVPATPGGLILP